MGRSRAKIAWKGPRRTGNYTADHADADQAIADYTASLPTKRMAAAVLFFDESGRVLVVEPTYVDYWVM